MTKTQPVLTQLQPIEVIWNDSSWLGGWHNLEEAESLTASKIVTRGYFIALTQDEIIVAQHHGNHKVHGKMVASVTAILLTDVATIRAVKESYKEKLLRLF